MVDGSRQYVSTFIAGFGEMVSDALKQKLANVVVETLLDGLILYRSTSPVGEVQKLRFANNSFLSLRAETHPAIDKVEAIVRRLFGRADLAPATAVTTAKQVRTFRVIISKENATVAIDPALLAGVEKKIAHQLKLTVRRALPDVEFWFLLRREGLCFFGVRMTALGKQRTRKYTPGELRQELCHLLCLLSEPSGKDVVLDPFCGSGALVLEWLHNFPVRHILAGDEDPTLVAALQRKLARQRNVTVAQWDARALMTVAGSSVDKIITDPPWGFFKGETVDFALFYTEMLAEFARVLKPGGLAVVLVGRKDEFTQALAALAGRFEPLKEYHVLVSGKKAAVYKLRRLT